MNSLIQVQADDFHTVSVYKVIRAGNCTSSLYFFQPVTNLLLEECLLLIPITWLPICSFLWQHSDFCVRVYEYHLLDCLSIRVFLLWMYFKWWELSGNKYPYTPYSFLYTWKARLCNCGYSDLYMQIRSNLLIIH